MVSSSARQLTHERPLFKTKRRGGKKKKSNTNVPLESVMDFGFLLPVDDYGILHIQERGSGMMGQIPNVNAINISNDLSNTGPISATKVVNG
ncbi:hypothetical protein Tco_0986423, partial [Tanacetum coccineum]